MKREQLDNLPQIFCCVEVSSEYEPKAKFAIDHLLLQLGYKVQYVGRDELRSPGMYYGRDISAIAEEHLRLKYDPFVSAYFHSREAYNIKPIEVFEENLTWVLLFPYEDDLISHQTADRVGSSKAQLCRFFDPIAASFYWLSDWQYLSTTRRDAHGRLTYALSLQKEFSCDCLPFVDYYAEILSEVFRQNSWPVKKSLWGGHQMAACLTHDIDYLTKWRKGILYRDLVQRREAPYQVLSQLGKKDPFKMSFDFMMEEEKSRDFKATWFLKCGGDGRHDVVYNHNSPWLRSRIDDLKKLGHEIGLHGSYFTFDDADRFASEYLELQKIAGETVSTRQHYLRVQDYPMISMYQKAGIEIDSSIAFADREGFRTGTTIPHRIFDKDNNSVTDIWEFPLSVMETTFKTYRKKNLEESLLLTKRIIDLCQRFGGLAVLLWHNIIKDSKDFADLDVHFEKSLDYLESKDCLKNGFSETLAAHGK